MRGSVKVMTSAAMLLSAVLGFKVEAATAATTAGTVPNPSCDEPARICGLDGPEDLVAIGDGAEVIAARLGGKGLDIIDTRTHKVTALDPATLPETPSPLYPCKDLKTSGDFVSHGLSVKRGADGSDRLLVVRHGGREAIEMFRFTRPGDATSLSWLGCVPLPAGFQANAVTGRRDGGFYVTSMLDEGSAPGAAKLAKLYGVLPSGAVLAWTPGGGFKRVPMGTMSGPNGIELSADERWLYVDGWASHEILRLDLLHPEAAAKRLHVSFMPDNLRWAPDGSLISAGVESTPKRVFDCAGSHADGSPCATHWTVARIDATTMTLKARIHRDDHSGFGDVSVALPVDAALWLGDFDGHSIAIEPGDPLK